MIRKEERPMPAQMWAMRCFDAGDAGITTKKTQTDPLPDVPGLAL